MQIIVTQIDEKQKELENETTKSHPDGLVFLRTESQDSGIIPFSPKVENDPKSIFVNFFGKNLLKLKKRIPEIYK